MEINASFNTGKIQDTQKKESVENPKLKQACNDFEAIFIGMMLKTMRSTVPEDTLFGSSNQKEIFQSMFDQEMAKNIANSKKSLGVGEMLYRQLKHGKE